MTLQRCLTFALAPIYFSLVFILIMLPCQSVFAQTPALDQLTQSLLTQQDALKSAKKQKDEDYKRIQMDQQSVKSLTGALRAAEAVLAKAKQNAPKKWRCYAYNSLHNDPSECSNPGAGGVWITQPTDETDQAEDDIRRIKQSLDDKRKGYKGLKNKYNQEYKEYLNADKKLKADLDQYKSLVRSTPDNKKLIDSIAQAATANSKDCANSVAAFSDKFGNKSLDGLRANEQIKYMADNWKQLTPQEAQERANQGKPTYFGKTDSPNGHDGMIVPGWLDTRFQQPSLAGGAMHKNADGTITEGQAYSPDGKTVTGVFGKHDLSDDQYMQQVVPTIKYYAPPD
jgi:hypothetical protein